MMVDITLPPRILLSTTSEETVDRIINMIDPELIVPGNLNPLTGELHFVGEIPNDIAMALTALARGEGDKYLEMIDGD